MKTGIIKPNVQLWSKNLQHISKTISTASPQRNAVVNSGLVAGGVTLSASLVAALAGLLGKAGHPNIANPAIFADGIVLGAPAVKFLAQHIEQAKKLFNR